MKKILLSILSIAVVGAVAFGATRAFFSDTETSTGNTFQAGAIDLKIDNTSYYNGVLSQLTTRTPSDLTGKLFFNFTDLKPGDIGEDTISLHVNSNDAWACANIKITKDQDNTCTEPEIKDGDPECTTHPADGTGKGELSQNLNFIFWADDGDNVLETNEQVLTQGLASNVLSGITWKIADSTGNIFGGTGPLLAKVEGQDKTYYIGKAWCFGTLTPSPVPEPGVVHDPIQTPGVTCDGTLVNNQAQTDILMGDISFYAVQARNNKAFVCSDSVFPTVKPLSTP